MLALSDARWSSFTHAYGPAKDIPALLSRARDDTGQASKPGTAWFDLWSALCHQGDTYTASYAAVPHLVQLAPDQLKRQRYDALYLTACIELARLEGPVAGGDDQRPAEEGAALVRRDREQLLAVLAQALERLDFLAQSHVGAVLEPLLGAEIDQRLTLDLRIAGDVEDVLLRIDGGDLTADLLEALDDPHGRVAMARVVRGGEAGRAGTEDRNVDDVAHAPDASARFCSDVVGGREVLMAPSGAAPLRLL